MRRVAQRFVIILKVKEDISEKYLQDMLKEKVPGVIEVESVLRAKVKTTRVA